MSSNLTGRAQSSLGAVAIPTDGDDWSSHTGATPYLGSFQEMLDRMTLGITSALLIRTGGHDFSVDDGGSSSSFTVRVSGLVVQVQDSSSVYRAHYSLAELTAGAAQIEGGGTLNADGWHFVYLVSPGTLTAAPNVVLSTLGPAANRLHRSDSTRYLYIGAFPTDSAGAPIPLRAVRGRYTYRAHTVGAITGATAQRTAGISTWTGDLSIASRIPPHARNVRLRITSHRASAGVGLWSLRASGDTLASWDHSFNAFSIGHIDHTRAEIALKASPAAQAVQVATEPNTTIDTIDADGWDE